MNISFQKKMSPIFSHQLGVGMIEVLVALVITSFAMLGLAGLQVTSLRFQKTAHYRSLASLNTADIADRMRANVAGAKANNYVTTDPYLANPSLAAGACPTSSATIADVATKDLCEWRLNLKNTVNGGWGEVSGDVLKGFTITVYFKEPSKNDKTTGGIVQESTPDANCTASVGMDVRCFKTVFLP
ncbi:type IV pilus modification protein PilV [Undibacterium sp. Jales W-56]|uniref:type IV pilus modification protein PilV n=1 Tax=Undibacterium sp. Jales W-56 TaxID=2897325 RepID=UPI0021D1AD1B|nr:type IV pilus modification protein PilV [Undibacterium sp. Jales W-56]MCU6435653.1 type IV pilus modification protein PilV [Undibacterium sp. Jales W-56]